MPYNFLQSTAKRNKIILNSGSTSHRRAQQNALRPPHSLRKYFTYAAVKHSGFSKYLISSSQRTGLILCIIYYRSVWSDSHRNYGTLYSDHFAHAAFLCASDWRPDLCHLRLAAGTAGGRWNGPVSVIFYLPQVVCRKDQVLLSYAAGLPVRIRTAMAGTGSGLLAKGRQYGLVMLVPGRSDLDVL